MKIIITILIAFSSFVSIAQEYEMTGRDTINMTDANGKKQGKWILRAMHKPGKCTNIHQTLEEGMYKDNKRLGVWKEYHCNGKLKSSITYVNGHPEGPTTMYYDNGSVKEDGTWKQNRWVGAYKSVDDAGNTTEIVFDEKGKEVSKKITPAKKKK
jgi:hypothetical protein